LKRGTFAVRFERIIRSRALLAQAIHADDESRMLEVAKLTIEENADLVDEIGDLLKLDDPREDRALVFSEFSPDGVVVPLSWVPQFERSSKEPVTWIRVSADMADSVLEALKYA